MILMQIVAMVREDHVRREAALEFLEVLFDFSRLRGEEAVTKVFDGNPRLAGSIEE